jgi:hypothetical protein
VKRAARRAAPQQKSGSGAAMSLFMPRGASAAPARRRAAAVEACTLPATPVRLCYSCHAAVMWHDSAQRVRADE